MSSVYFSYPSDSACPYHRSLLPARHCAPAFARAGWEFHVGPGLPAGHDVLILHGLPNETGVLEIAKRRRGGCKFVWSLDDDFLSIPDWSPARLTDQGLALYDLTKAQADHIIVSTPAIARTFPDHPVHVAPNLLDLSVYPTPPWEGRAGEHLSPPVELPVRVVWAGGHTHQGDLEPVIPAIDRIMRRLGPDRVQVVFFGMQPPGALLKDHLHRGVLWQPPVPFPLYHAMMSSLRAHVWLAPLAQIPFNESKSALRVFEGWAMNAAVVATPWGEYNCVRSGVDGRYATDTDSWVSALDRLVTDHQYRIQMAADGRQRVVAVRNWKRAACRVNWISAFAAVLGIDPPADED